MMRGIILVLAMLVGLLMSRPVAAEDLLIIANRSVTVAAPLGLGRIAAIYLLRMTTWPDGTHIVPVNREATSMARETFASRVLREDNATLAVYWNEMHYRGKLPPVVQELEQAMLAFVQKVPGAIGYIGTATRPVGVRVLGRVREVAAGKGNR